MNLNGLCMTLILWMHNSTGWTQVLFLFSLPVIGSLLALGSWWRDLLFEGDLGFQTRFVVKAYRDGMALFILSEAMMFSSFFWAFFHSSMSPSTNLDMMWPPLGVRCPKPFSTALFSTSLLIVSSIFCVWAHKAVKSRDYDWAPILGTGVSVGCGGSFVLVQYQEYYWNSFTIADSVFGSCFYVLTGFHGAHVVVGSLWLSFTLFRLMRGDFTNKRHFGLQACFWYWHFVDVIWILVWFWFYLWFGGWAFEKYMNWSGKGAEVISGP